MKYPTSFQKAQNVPLLRGGLRFLTQVKQSVRRMRLRKRKEDLRRLSQLLDSDPIINLPIFEGRFHVDPRSDIFARIVLNNGYEPEHAQLCLNYLDSSRDAIDIGANVGFYTVLFSKNLRGRKVLAIEPTKNASDRLRKNLALNNTQESTIHFEGVASEKNGSVLLNTIEGKEEFSSIGKMDHPSISNESFVEIETLSATLDSLVSKHKLIPGFIKVDVEGAEHLVFQGAQSVLREHRPIIFSEVSDYLLKRNGSSAKEVMESISQNNYKIIDPFNPHVRPENQDFTDILCLPE